FSRDWSSDVCSSDLMWRHTITHTLDASDGIVHISNGLQFLQDTYIDQAYFGMLPVESVNSERLLLDNGVETYDISSESGPTSFGWNVKSALFADRKSTRLNSSH